MTRVFPCFLWDRPGQYGHVAYMRVLLFHHLNLQYSTSKDVTLRPKTDGF
jgi:hypothetical protein